jgi:hypothetical protein
MKDDRGSIGVRNGAGNRCEWMDDVVVANDSLAGVEGLGKVPRRASGAALR